MFRVIKDNKSLSIKSQIATLEPGKFSKYLPNVFTEHGILMLSSVLRSDTAIQVNIQIMRTFIMLRKYSLNYDELSERINELEHNYTDIYQALDNLLKKDKINSDKNNFKKIGYK